MADKSYWIYTNHIHNGKPLFQIHIFTAEGKEQFTLYLDNKEIFTTDSILEIFVEADSLFNAYYPQTLTVAEIIKKFVKPSSHRKLFSIEDAEELKKRNNNGKTI